MKGKISDKLESAIQAAEARRRTGATYSPHLAPAVIHVPAVDTTIKEIPVTKQTALQFLRAELTEERTDAAIRLIGAEAKHVLPDIPVEIAERLLDWLLPTRVLDAIDRALD